MKNTGLIMVLMTILMFSAMFMAPNAQAMPGPSAPLMGVFDNMVSSTVVTTPGNTLIAEAPANQRLVLTQVWSDTSAAMSIKHEDVSSGATLELFNSQQIWEGVDTNGAGQLEEVTGWTGHYVLEPGDKLWAMNNNVTNGLVHLTGVLVQ